MSSTDHPSERYIISLIVLSLNNALPSRILLKKFVCCFFILVVTIWCALAIFDLYVIVPMRHSYPYIMYQYLLFLPAVGQGLFDYLFISG